MRKRIIEKCRCGIISSPKRFDHFQTADSRHPQTPSNLGSQNLQTRKPEMDDMKGARLVTRVWRMRCVWHAPTDRLSTVCIVTPVPARSALSGREARNCVTQPAAPGSARQLDVHRAWPTALRRPRLQKLRRPRNSSRGCSLSHPFRCARLLA